MSEEIWERINQFLMELRCENTSRSSKCTTKEVQSAEREQKEIKNFFEVCMEKMEESDRRVIEKYVESMDNLAVAQCQQSYLQGYIDCVLLLSGVGILAPDKSVTEIVKRIKE